MDFATLRTMNLPSLNFQAPDLLTKKYHFNLVDCVMNANFTCLKEPEFLLFLSFLCFFSGEFKKL